MTICIISHEKKLTDYLQEIIEKENLKTIGYENNNLTVSEYEKFSEKLTAKLFPTLGIVEKFREIKTDEEIKLIQKACDFTDKCLSDIVRIIKPGLTEAEIAFKMEMWIKQRGLDLAFYPIVAVDENSAEAHFDTRTWGKAKVKKDSIVLIDFGIMYKNYRSDMTRMVFVGHPNKEIVRTYEALLAAQEAGIKALFNTNKSSEIDAECRKLLKQLKLPNYTHSTGHGVGLEIHENPRLSPTSSDSLQKGHVFTIEPGIYIPGKYGMRIEDTIVLTDDLSPKVLTKFSKKLLII
jgi:Xaa-Pro aminopeptidase